MADKALQAVTGASGFIGGVLVRQLLAGGAAVRAIERRPSASLAGLELERVSADLTEPESLLRAFAGADTVYHLASVIPHKGIGSGGMLSLNIGGTRAVLEACREAGVRRLVYVGSVNAFAPHPRHLAVAEHRPLVADGERAPPYSRSKAAAQALVLEAAGSGLETVVACPSAVIGPLDFGPSPLGQLVLDLSRGGLPLLINGGCNLVDVRDLTAGIIACGQRGRSGESYLLGGVDVSLATLAALVGETAGRRWRPALPMPVAYLGLPFMAAARWMGADKPLYSADTLWPLRFHRKVSSQKARDELGYATRPISQTVRETVEWFRQRMRDD